MSSIKTILAEKYITAHTDNSLCNHGRNEVRHVIPQAKNKAKAKNDAT